MIQKEQPLELLHIIVLALIQGITEFLPISSSAHLILPGRLLGWPDQGLAFDTAVHLGSLFAVVFYFRQDIFSLTTAALTHIGTGTATPQSRYAFNLLLASLPIIPVGFLGRFFIEEHLRSIEVIAATTIVFGLALWFADARRQPAEGETELTPGRALGIGFAQCLALIPGTSRSGITITAALLMGYGRAQAARISMLISIPTIAGAATLKLWDLVENADQIDWVAISLGTALAGVSAYTCIRLFLNLVERIGMLPFVVYRLLLGGFLMMMILL